MPLDLFVDRRFDGDSVGTLDLGIIFERGGGTLTLIDLKTGRLPGHTFYAEERHRFISDTLKGADIFCFMRYSSVFLIGGSVQYG